MTNFSASALYRSLCQHTEAGHSKLPYYLANQAVYAPTELAVYDKYSQQHLASVALADAASYEQAIAQAVQAEAAMRAMPAYQRRAVLEHCVMRFTQEKDLLTEVLIAEAGKILADAQSEVARLIITFQLAAEQATRMQGEYWDLAIAPRWHGFSATTQRVPVGACGLIAPFNFPLNLVAHKVAPAIAAGCPWVLKPASYTPISALLMGAILAETDLPKGAFSILPGSRESADVLVTDARLKLLSFTGSPDLGWAMKARAGKKKVVLELGGNAACIVAQDQQPQLSHIVSRLAFGAFYQSGQSCIHVQRIYVHRSLYEELKQSLLKKIAELQIGDPQDPKTFIGPLIAEREADRVDQWLQEALAAGARLLCGGKRRPGGAAERVMFEPTLLEHCPKNCKVYAEEVFGPIAILQAFDDFAEALQLVNDSRFGLQAGVFTNSIQQAQLAWDQLQVAAVLIGEIPSFRADQMPYGGVKDSGFGREGIRYAMEDMTELRMMVVKRNL